MQREVNTCCVVTYYLVVSYYNLSIYKSLYLTVYSIATFGCYGAIESESYLGRGLGYNSLHLI